MSIQSKLKKLLELPKSFLCHPKLSLRLMTLLPYVRRAFNYSQGSKHCEVACSEYVASNSSNPLRDYFDSHKTGRGIWKWDHYFDIYHQYFSKYIGKDLNILEIGIYSGGSLEMWRHYFGDRCYVYGVDIENSCKCYENEHTKIFIGDQADREFWKAIKKTIPTIDVMIDDGGHQTEQQIVTLEEMLPHLRPGGIYLCEDTHGIFNTFSAYAYGLASNLNEYRGISPTEFQSWFSIHFYPYVTIVEKADSPMKELIAPKHGTEWQPFL